MSCNKQVVVRVKFKNLCNFLKFAFLAVLQNGRIWLKLNVLNTDSYTLFCCRNLRVVNAQIFNLVLHFVYNNFRLDAHKVCNFCMSSTFKNSRCSADCFYDNAEFFVIKFNRSVFCIPINSLIRIAHCIKRIVNHNIDRTLSVHKIHGVFRNNLVKHLAVYRFRAGICILNGERNFKRCLQIKAAAQVMGFFTGCSPCITGLQIFIRKHRYISYDRHEIFVADFVFAEFVTLEKAVIFFAPCKDRTAGTV